MSRLGFYIRQLNSLINEKKEFEQLLSDLVGKLIPALNKPINSLENAIEGISKNYTIDLENADNGSFENNKKKIEDIIENINNVIIPEINARIKKIEQEIKELESLIQQLEEEESEESGNS